MGSDKISSDELMKDAGEYLFSDKYNFMSIINKYSNYIHAAHEKCPYLFRERMDKYTQSSDLDIFNDISLIVVLYMIGSNTDVCRHNEYLAYLRSEAWRSIAKEVKDKAGSKCAVCNSINSLNVHHKTYENLYHEKEEDLICLCKKCHSKFHNKD